MHKPWRGKVVKGNAKEEDRFPVRWMKPKGSDAWQGKWIVDADYSSEIVTSSCIVRTIKLLAGDKIGSQWGDIEVAVSEFGEAACARDALECAEVPGAQLLEEMVGMVVVTGALVGRAVASQKFIKIPTKETRVSQDLLNKKYREHQKQKGR
jgi:hypothetical protein